LFFHSFHRTSCFFIHRLLLLELEEDEEDEDEEDEDEDEDEVESWRLQGESICQNK